VTAFRDADDVRGVLSAFLERFLASEDGAEASAQSGLLESSAVLELRIVDPDVVLHVDFAARSVADGPAEDAGALAEIPADDLHDLLLDRLGPIEISRLVEEHRVQLEGPPPALAALLVLAGRIQPHYPASLAEQGREDLLATPTPAVGEIWGNDEPPPTLVGVRRPWQRQRGALAGS
jgi:hypothetical protein